MRSPYSPQGERIRDELFEELDEMPEWQVQLVWEYGTKRTLEAIRRYPTPKAAREALERDRQARQYMPLAPLTRR